MVKLYVKVKCCEKKLTSLTIISKLVLKDRQETKQKEVA